ncbi:MAG: metallopeptidase family protein [Candidatus Saccharibacteria bacterium]|nr:metallopeptidase family protein [Candidatus Saccharibacteria bacterium]
MHVSDERFEEIINLTMDELPQKYIAGLDNVAITYEDEPSPGQREKLKLRCDSLLFGLYEGVPRTSRGGINNLVLPDKITLFKKPILHVSADEVQLKSNVKHTLWHEIAHYYGLDHEHIHAIEKRWRK